DGTLYSNAVMYLKSLPFAVSHLRLMLAFSGVRREIRKQRPISDIHALEAEMLGERLGCTPEEARERIERQIYVEWESVLDRVKPYAHARECVEGLREAGFAVGVSSDFPVERKLDRLGLGGLFDCRLWTADSGYLKPHPEPFLAISECLGCQPAEILYVGNSYEYDVVGAKRAGMAAAHLSARPKRDTIADLTFNDYRTLCAWVRANAAAL
ncbi:MAG: HAD family hydrolase, partial [Spirochaetota bacterium]